MGSNNICPSIEELNKAQLQLEHQLGRPINPSEVETVLQAHDCKLVNLSDV